MSTLSPFYLLNRPCDEALVWAKAQLSQAGLRVLETFDLHAARHTSTDDPCPYHGTSTCDCQIVILLIYGTTNEPATLILKGSDGKTCFLLESNSLHQVDSIMYASIEEALQCQYL